MLLNYSDDNDLNGTEDMGEIKDLIQRIFDFSNKYRKKPKTKVVKGSIKLPKTFF